MSATAPDRLETWKEIADYLGVTVKTAQRYEKQRGLPIHALPGGDKRTVYALKSEIEVWRAGESSAEGGETVVSPARRARRWVWALAAIVAVASLAAYRWTRPRSAARVTVNSQEIVGRDADGRTAWRYRVPEPVMNVDQHWIQKNNFPNAEPGFLVAPLIEDGRHVQTTMYFFTGQGKLLWTYRPELTIRFGQREFQSPWAITSLLGAGDVARTALVAAAHHNWWPTFVAELDTDGRSKIKFIHAGHIYSLYRHRTAAGVRLLAGGVSNEHDGAMLAILPEASEVIGMPERKDPRYHCDECGSATPERYYVLPRCELNLADGQPYNKVSEIVPERDGVRVETQELAPPNSTGVRYNFSRDLQLESVSVHDTFWDVHRRLEREGIIHHAAAECPERLSRNVLEWTPQQGWRTLKIPAEESLPVAR